MLTNEIQFNFIFSAGFVLYVTDTVSLNMGLCKVSEVCTGNNVCMWMWMYASLSLGSVDL